MYSMNFSDIRPQIYSYLGFHGTADSNDTDTLISSCLSELERAAQFNYLYKAYEEIPEFLQKPPYIEFLRGCTGVILSVMTLGAEVDKRINRLLRTDMSRAVGFDACASAYLETLSDEYEKNIGNSLTYRFCPGYGGSSVEDLRYIFDLLHPEKIGVTIGESLFMLPSKSMAGVIGIGKTVKKTCEGCFVLPHCRYREEGMRCYSSERT